MNHPNLHILKRQSSRPRFKTLGEKMKKTIIAAIVVLVIVIAAVGIYFTVLDKDDKDKNEITFLIEDDQGVYFWIKGTGETGKDAFIDAAEKSGIDYDYTDSSFGMFISEINGLAGGVSYNPYWALYVYENGEWISSEQGISSIVSADHDYLGWFFVYADDQYNVTLPEVIPNVKDAKVWNKDSTSGTVFTIASPTEMYFRINGSSNESLMDAFSKACSEYKVPLVKSDDGEISTIFGFGKDAGKDWNKYSVENNAWKITTEDMSDLSSADHSKFLVFYSEEGVTPIMPI